MGGTNPHTPQTEISDNAGARESTRLGAPADAGIAGRLLAREYSRGRGAAGRSSRADVDQVAAHLDEDADEARQLELLVGADAQPLLEVGERGH